MREWFEEESVLIVDRGYRDATEWFEKLGITRLMPALLAHGTKQFTTEEANRSRIITRSGWIVEARNGHLTTIFKFLKNATQIRHAVNLHDFYLIAGAIIYKYRPLIDMHGADVELTRTLLRKVRDVNVLQQLVEQENLHRRNRHRWVRLSSDQIQNFPRLTLDFLKELTVGAYQVQLAKSYIKDKLQREQDEVFQIEVVNRHNCNDIPERGIIRVRLYSRCRNATNYQLWIAYVSTDENEPNNNEEPIQGYYCTCKTGARTLSTCAHVTTILWFLGFVRYENDIRYPTTCLIQEIIDAAHRPQQQNPN